MGPYGDENGPRLGTAANFALQSGSPFVDTGATVTGHGGPDFAGSPVPSGNAPEIGAFERGAPGIALTNTDTFDNPATGAFTPGTNGWRVISTGNGVSVAEAPSAPDKSVRLIRTADDGGTDGTDLARLFSTRCWAW